MRYDKDYDEWIMERMTITSDMLDEMYEYFNSQNEEVLTEEQS